MKRISIICLTLFLQNSHAQELSNIHKKEAYGLHTDFQLQSILRKNNNQKLYFQQFFNGSIKTKIANVDLPFTWSWSNGSNSFSHPFNQFKFHPSWKWIKTQIGHATLNFSPYVLSAMPVSGFAIELDKNSKHLSVITGRIRKASLPDPENTSGPFYPERWCVGLKLGIQKSDLRLQISGVYASDRNLNESQITDIPFVPAESGFSVSVNVEKKILNNWRISLEQAASLNTYLPNREETPDKKKFYSTKPDFAGIYRLRYSKKQELNFFYERVGQEYKSLCSWYFISGVENGGVELNSGIFKQKINLSFKTGIQKKILSLDDLRMLLQLRVNSKVLKTGNISLAFNNQTTIQRNNPFLRPDEIAIPQDTMYLFAVQKNLQSNLSLPIPKLQNTWFSAVANYNAGSQLKGITIISEKQLESSLSILNMICTITRKFNAQKSSFSLGVNYNQSTNSNTITNSKGGQFSITHNRKHGDKIMLQSALFFNQTKLIQNRIAWSGTILTTKSKKELIQLHLQMVWQLLVLPVKTQNFLLCATLSLKVS